MRLIRLGRIKYVLLILLAAVCIISLGPLAKTANMTSQTAMLLGVLFTIGITIIVYKRTAEIGYSSWLILLTFLPLIGILYMIWLAIKNPRPIETRKASSSLALIVCIILSMILNYGAYYNRTQGL